MPVPPIKIGMRNGASTIAPITSIPSAASVTGVARPRLRGKNPPDKHDYCTPLAAFGAEKSTFGAADIDDSFATLKFGRAS